MRQLPNVLTIAGSDSSGGAGIQADIRTFTALKVYGASVVTNITAQNSQGVQSVFALPATVVAEQLSSVLSDIDFLAVKIGMLYTDEIIHAVASAIKKHNIKNVIVDPVLLSTSGTPLLHQSSRQTLVEEIFPLARIITPNLPEAHSLLNASTQHSKVTSGKDMAESLCEMYNCGVLVKGGHIEGEVLTDHLAIDGNTYTYEHHRIPTKNTHGTGCTMSSAIAAFVASGHSPANATKLAIKFMENCLSCAEKLKVGKSYGPVNQILFSATL